VFRAIKILANSKEALMNMNMPVSNAPAPSSGGSGGISSWFSTWITAFTKPNEQTFAQIADSPNASFGTAALWVFIAGTVSALIQAILQGVLSLVGFHARFPGMGTMGLGAATSRGIGSIALSVCLSPVSGIVSVVAFIIAVAIFQGMAKLFHGAGSFTKLTYPIAAVFVPISLVLAIFTPFVLVPVLGICAGIVLFVGIVYNIVLEIMAVKAVNSFGWGAAVGSVLIVPGVLLLCSCLVLVPLMLMGPMIGNVFSSINQSLAP
jgi:hypothetical protein